jgi:hypothetical protein
VPLYLLSSTRTASQYLLHVIGAYLKATGRIGNVLGEIAHYHRHEATESYVFENGQLRFLGYEPRHVTRDEFKDQLRQRFAWLRQDRNVFFKMLGKDLYHEIDGTPIHRLLAALQFRPILLQRRDRERHFLSYACMLLTSRAYHYDPVVTDYGLVCPRQIYEHFCDEEAALSTAVEHFVAPIQRIYTEDLRDPISDLTRLGFTDLAGIDFSGHPLKTVYDDGDPYRHFANADEIKTWLTK